MVANDSVQDAGRLEFRHPFWSGWKVRFVGGVFVLVMTVVFFESDQATTAYWVWLAAVCYSLIHWLRRDSRDLQKGGGRFVVNVERISSSRFGRGVTIPWSEITKVGYGAAHLRLVSPTDSVSIPINLPGYDRLHRFVYTHVPSAALETAHQLPIRVRYEVTSSVILGVLILWFVLLVGHGMLASSGYETSALLFVATFIVLLVWGVGIGVYRAMPTFEFHEDRIIEHSPFKDREYPTAGLLDMRLESESDEDTATVLNFILSGGEYLTVIDGNLSAGELYQILKSHYLPSRRADLPEV